MMIAGHETAKHKMLIEGQCEKLLELYCSKSFTVKMPCSLLVCQFNLSTMCFLKNYLPSPAPQ